MDKFPWLRRHAAWVVVGLMLLFVVVVRVRLLQMPLERDEGEYAYAGQLILQGVPPYQAAYNMKLPGTYAAYALIMAVFGQSPAGIHFGVLLVNAASIVLMFLLGRKLLDDAAGAAAAVSFGLLSLSPSVLGLAGHATHFVVLAALGGTLMLVSSLKSQVQSPKSKVQGREGGRAQKVGGGTAEYAEYAEKQGGDAESRTSGSRYQLSTINYRLLCAGLLFGIAFLMKQHGIFFGLFGVLYLVWVGVAERLGRDTERGARMENRGLRMERGSSRGRPSARPSDVAPRPSGTAPRLSHFAAAKKQAGQTPIASSNNPAIPPSNIPTAVSTAEHAGYAEKQTETTSLPATRHSALVSPKSDEGGFIPPKSDGGGFRIPHSALRIPTALDYLLFAAALALPYLLTCLSLWAAGVFPQFWFWTVSYAREYAAGNSLVDGPALLKVALRTAVGPNLILWLLPWFGALVMWWDHRLEAGARMEDRGEKAARIEDRELRMETEARRAAAASSLSSNPPSSILHPRSLSGSSILHPRFFLVGLFFCSFAAASVGLYFREHYFILVLPVISLLSGVAVSRALYLVRHDRTIELFLAAPILILLVLGLGTAMLGNGSIWFAPSAIAAHRSVYRTTLFIEAATMAESLKAKTSNGARILVLGSEPEIYFLSGRRSVTGYIYTYPLMDAQPYAARMQDQMSREVERHEPEYVIYVADDYSWLRQAESPRTLDQWWKNYWPRHFDLVSAQRIEEQSEDASALGTGAATIVPVSDELESLARAANRDSKASVKHLFLLKRKS